jgi:hypothetical protein
METPSSPAESRLVRLHSAGPQVLPGGGWQLGGAAPALDLAGTAYGTQAALQALDVWLSDVDSLSPGTLYGAVVASWSHVAGLGWRPASVVDGAGPGMIVPLMRLGNRELEVATAG